MPAVGVYIYPTEVPEQFYILRAACRHNVRGYRRSNSLDTSARLVHDLDIELEQHLERLEQP